MVTKNAVNTYIVPTVANEVTWPLQPAFLAYLGTQDSNVTGDGTPHTLGTDNALTEIFDQNADFVTTGTFTAPVTGRYFFQVFWQTLDIGAGMTNVNMEIISSNRTWQIGIFNPLNFLNVATGGYGYSASAIIDMDAADTAHFNVNVTGGAKVVDIRAGADPARTYVSGYLLC